MQNNEHSESNRFRKFLQEKGYYIVLFLCILAVGISGYLFVSGAVSEKKSLNEQTLSVATSAEIPEDKSSSSGSKPQQGGKTQAQKPASGSAAGSQDTADAAIRSASIRDNFLFICASSKINIFFCLVKRNIAVD